MDVNTLGAVTRTPTGFLSNLVQRESLRGPTCMPIYFLFDLKNGGHICCFFTPIRVSCRPVLGGRLPPPKKSVTPPNIFTDFIFIHPEPPTPRLLPPQSPSTPPPPPKKKGEMLQETLPMITLFWPLSQKLCKIGY